MKPVFLITDKAPEEFIAGIIALGFDVEFHPEYPNELLEKNIHRFTGIVTNSYMNLSDEMLKKTTSLKYILRPGSGLDMIALETARDKNILVFSSPEANKNAVAEHAIGSLLSLMNNIPKSVDEIKNHIWKREENTGEELAGKTIGIIGFGNTGSALAKKLSGFDMKILAYDKYKTGISTEYISEVSLGRIQQEADIISFHIPLNIETKHLLNDEFISQCRKEVYIVNTSRGGVVHLSSLLQNIYNKKIKGAVLDVLENEKFATYTQEDFELLDKLIATRKVLITPHIAGWSTQARRNIFMLVLEKFSDYLKSA